MKNKIFFLIIVWFALGLTQYACEDDCPPFNKNLPSRFWVKDIGAEINGYWGFVIDSSAYNYYDSVFLDLFIKDATFAVKKNFSIINKAMACEPQPPPETEDKLKNLLIIATNAANDSGSIQILKGDTLNKYFNTRDNIGDFVWPIDSVISFFVIQSPNQRWQFKWNKQPLKPIIVSVDVHVLLNSGKEFRTNGLKLKLR